MTGCLEAVKPLVDLTISALAKVDFRDDPIAFYWAKTNKKANLAALSESEFFCGLGYWTRANVEQCLLATRGKPPRLARDVRRLIISPRREHSRKPDETYSRIERLARGPYLELFSRQTRAGWNALGSEVALFDKGPATTRNRPSNIARAKPSPLGYASVR